MIDEKDASKISGHYREMTADELAIFGEDYDRSWQDPTMPERQYRRVVADELLRFRVGEDILPYRVGLEALRMLAPMENPSLLDVGASSGYYSEVFRIGGYACRYMALDYSEHFKRIAERLYPGIDFKVGDARALPFEDGSFDIVFHGSAIIHIRDYALAIREAARVASRYVIFHRTPIEARRDTTYYAKEAYSLPVLEIHFSPSELVSLFEESGLRMIGEIDLFMTESGYGHRTYICEKQLAHHPV